MKNFKTILIFVLLINSLCSAAASKESNIELIRYLFTAVEANNAELARNTLKLGCDANSMLNLRSFEKSFDGSIPPLYSASHTALHHAVIINSPAMVKLLLEEKANPNILAKIENPRDLGATVLDYVFISKEIVQDLELYENSNAVVEFYKGIFKSILSNELKKEQIIRLLLEYGANVSETAVSDLEKQITNKLEMPPFYNNHPAYSYEKAKRLIFKKLNPKSLANDLHMAVILNDEKAVQCYLAHRDPYIKDGVNDKDKLGFTPLMWAFTRGNLNLAKIILEHCDNNRVNLDFTNNDDENALQLTKKHEHHEVVKLFRNFMIDCMYKTISEKIPKPLINVICEYSDF